MSPISATTRLRSIASPQPTLNTRPDARPASAPAAAKFASTTLSMWQKSRDCLPSPKMRGCFPASAAVMNFGITAAYSDFGSWRGPNTLK